MQTRRFVFIFVLLLASACGPIFSSNVELASLTPKDIRISEGYVKPASLEGFTDQIFTGPIAYSQFASLGFGSRVYNLYWSDLETLAIARSSTPIVCPLTHTLIPSSEAERVSRGYHYFRCIHTGMLNRYDAFFRQDAQNGLQSMVGLYSAPTQYHDPGCVGSLHVPGYINFQHGCVPRDDAMDDWEDFINVIAARYNGGANGKISHFIIWNENQSGTWFNYTPIVPSVGLLTTEQTDLWTKKLADMMLRAHSAIARNTEHVLLSVSLGSQFDPAPYPAPADSNISAKVLLDGLWKYLGTTIDWSLAVHPYGEPLLPAPAGLYTLNNLQAVVDYQKSKLDALGVPSDKQFPWAYVTATEQVPFDFTNPALTLDDKAKQMCIAHDVALAIPNLLAMSHNHFYQVDPLLDPLGLIPYQPGLVLTGTNVALNFDPWSPLPATWQAYAAMNPLNWKTSNDNYCCQSSGYGCQSSTMTPAGTVLGYVDGIFNTGGQVHVDGWACSYGSSQPISVQLYRNGVPGVGVAVGAPIAANSPSAPAIATSCGTGALRYRFSIPIDSAIAAAYSGQSIYVSGLSPFGRGSTSLDRNGALVFP